LYVSLSLRRGSTTGLFLKKKIYIEIFFLHRILHSYKVRGGGGAHEDDSFEEEDGLGDEDIPEMKKSLYGVARHD
jgi:hypothetical protein